MCYTYIIVCKVQHGQWVITCFGHSRIKGKSKQGGNKGTQEDWEGIKAM